MRPDNNDNFHILLPTRVVYENSGLSMVQDIEHILMSLKRLSVAWSVKAIWEYHLHCKKRASAPKK